MKQIQLENEGAATITIAGHSRGCWHALALSKELKQYPNIKIRLCLYDPIKGPISNPILSNNTIPENVETCLLHYSGHSFFSHLGDKSILRLKNPDKTKLEVCNAISGRHLIMPPRFLNIKWLRTFKTENRIVILKNYHEKATLKFTAPPKHKIITSFMLSGKLPHTREYPDGSYAKYQQHILPNGQRITINKYTFRQYPNGSFIKGQNVKSGSWTGDGRLISGNIVLEGKWKDGILVNPKLNKKNNAKNNIKPIN